MSNLDNITEKAKQVWDEIKEHSDVFWIGASFGVLIGALFL